MARAATRSQRRAPGASQSQPRSSQNKGISRRNGDSNEEDDGDESQTGTMDVDENGDENEERDGGGTEIERKATELVRLALFNEHKRIPLRREDISKKVLGPNTRAFNRVLDDAQDILRKTFGMELVELQSRAGLERDGNNANEDELNEARNATGIKKKAAVANSKTYILRSILDPIIIEHAALTDEQILEEESADAPSDDDDDDSPIRSYGSIISWSTVDQLGATGVLYTILALILVSGRVISDMDLRGHLKRLHLPPTGTVPFNTQSTHRSVGLEAYLSTLIRQGYLDRQQIGDAAKGKGKGKGAKRGRATQADDEAGMTYEWRWGNRAQSEVGEKGIAQFVAEFMVGDAGGDDDGDDDDVAAERRMERSQGDAEAKLARMMKGIQRAAGGQLADLR